MFIVFGETVFIWYGLRWRSHDYGLCHLLRAANATLDNCCFSTGGTDNWNSCPIVLFNCWLYFCLVWQTLARNKTLLMKLVDSVSHTCDRNLKHLKTFCSCIHLYLLFSYIGSILNIKKYEMALKNHCEGHQTRLTNTNIWNDNNINSIAWKPVFLQTVNGYSTTIQPVNKQQQKQILTTPGEC